jgi:peptidoglycan/xylan/chitin deacetylase (PgdA/CDA1 family)
MAGVVLATAALAGAPPRIVTHGPRNVSRVALTFDVCPTRPPVELDERIVAALRDARAPATFFVSGRWARSLPDVVRHLAAEPLFEIGNHTFHHPHLRKLDDEEIRHELVATQDLLDALTGHAPRWFRPPFGEVDERVAGVAEGVGLTTVQFDVASGDPAPGVTAATLVRTVLERAKAGSIVVLHANHRRFPTADALPAIIAGLRAKGLQLVTVGDLVAPDAVEPAP